MSYLTRTALQHPRGGTARRAAFCAIVTAFGIACACADPASLESPDGDTAISTDAASSDAAGAATQVMVQPSCVVGTATSGSGRKLTPTGASLATGVAQSPSGRTLSPAPGPLR